ncbi:MAG: hypothetical protein FIB04_04710 [Gammaproteobacteria bacterium]|nr:hypothetical protein [Gammaproteobacteria bacterium]
MNALKRLLLAAVGTVVLAVAPTSPTVAADAGTVIVSIYYVAPGKHVDFLKWAAAQDAVAKEAGVGATQWYAHQDGDAWDYIAISPATTPDQDRKVDEVAKKHGQKSGMAAGLVMRQYISRHTDTFAYGPVSATDLLKHVSQ